MGTKAKISSFSLLTLAALAGAWPLGADSSLHLKSPEARVSLLELYSSEGCSSCPPADAWLSSLRSDKRVWKEVIPVAFHVDYWNYLGWTDPLSSPQASDRQRRYAQEQGSGRVYTPEFVLNGSEWSVGGSWKNGEKVGVLKVDETGQWEYIAQFTPVATGGSYTLHAALLGNGLVNQVKTGENAGTRLRHDFVLLQLVSQPMKAVGGTYSGKARVVPPARIHPASYSLAFWVSKTGEQRPVQAVGGDLP